MDVAAPITAVVPTLDAHVLTVLARANRPLTGQQVHRLAGHGSPNGIRNVLTRLTHQGIVHAAAAGQATIYTANRAHLAWDGVESLTNIRKTLVARLSEAIGNWNPPAVSAALFGSAARGDGHADSDIDVLFIRADHTGLKGWNANVDDLRDAVTSWTGNNCQIYDITETELRTHLDAREPIVEDWRKDAIDLAGEPIARLLSHTRTTR